MATWLYADYEAQASEQARLDRARLHHAEVSQAMGVSFNIGDRGKQYQSLVEYLRMIITRIGELERLTGGSSGLSNGIHALTVPP